VPDRLLGVQEQLERKLVDGSRDPDAVQEYFATFRHLITLLFGENRGLEELRRIVASSSCLPRPDKTMPYEPDADVVPFEEASVAERAGAMMSADWLIEDWPERFVQCCQEARIEFVAVNRYGAAARIRMFQDALKLIRVALVPKRKYRRKGSVPDPKMPAPEPHMSIDDYRCVLVAEFLRKIYGMDTHWTEIKEKLKAVDETIEDEQNR
jgi:hypothetical protein